MTRHLVLSLWILLLCGTTLSAQPTIHEYSPPQCIEAKLAPVGPVKEGAPMSFEGHLTSLLGDVTNISVEFYGSEDLTIEPGSFTQEGLTQGQRKAFSVRIQRKAGPPQGGAPLADSWVRMRVEYLPDFLRVREAIETDVRGYPAVPAREALLRSIEGARAEGIKGAEIVEYNFLEGLDYTQGK